MKAFDSALLTFERDDLAKGLLSCSVAADGEVAGVLAYVILHGVQDAQVVLVHVVPAGGHLVTQRILANLPKSWESG